MHIKSVGAALALALFSTSAMVPAAMAADLPSRRAPPPVYTPPPIPVFSWTGLYIGAQVGYEFGRSSGYSSVAATGAPRFSGGASPGGVIGGGHVGYLWSTQSLPGLGGGFLGSGGVIGVEGDVDGSNYNSTYALGGITAYNRQNIQGSIRGRLGVAVDRVLFYATGGAAFGGLSNTYFTGAGTTTYDHTRVGWTAGGGIEYAVTNNVSVRAEYRYTDFGTVTDPVGALNVRRRETDNRVQAGVSYKFDMFSPVAAPVVARY